MALSPWGMFLAADPIVQIVMASLVFASLVTWTILGSKTIAMNRATARLRESIVLLRQAPALSAVARPLPAPEAEALLEEAAGELAASRKAGILEHAADRAAVGLDRVVAGETRGAGFGVGTIATIGSTAPFVGLFGTVWGIMNSFVGIAKTQTTNLAVVAPGIAEALLATACGLVAAIPAVIIYNHLTRGLGGFRNLVGDASAMVTRLLSRELEMLEREGRPATSVHAPQHTASEGGTLMAELG